MSKHSCAYAFCDNLGIITGEEVTIKNKHYCKTCYEKLEIYNDIRDLLKEMLPNIIWTQAGKVLQNLIVQKKYTEPYIKFVLEYIKQNNKPFNYINGLIYYLSNYKIQEEYKNIIAKQKYNKIKNEIDLTPIETNDIIIDYSESEKWSDLI